VEQTTSFPENDRTTLTIKTATPKKLTIRIRKPAWATGVQVNVNAVKFNAALDSSGYLILTRNWKSGDKIELQFPMELYTESMPDNKNRIAILYGPVVLAGQLGKEMPDPVYGAPVLLTDSRNVNDWVKNAAQPLSFHLKGIAKPADVSLQPFYKTYDQHYNVYWDYFTNEEWIARQAAYQAEKERQRKLEERTIDIMRLGEMQPERDHNLKASEQSYTENAFGRGGLEVRNGGFFSFEMKVNPEVENVLLLSYLGDDRGRAFDIFLDGVKIGEQELKGAEPSRFFDVEYPISAELIKGKTRVEIKIQAHPKRTAGRVFSPRILKK
ncbi:MAG: glycoside hydrolase family 127 protein, partial [Gemmatimonadaceae bacterium]|nr:glycoside hydrolase family 127 protein [Chitinophagaceae bacterium]